MIVTLMVRHYYAPYVFEFDSVEEAAREAVRQLDNDQSFPDRIIEDGRVVWKQDGPFGPAMDRLYDLAAAQEEKE